MLTNELNDKIKETLSICDLHHTRMMFSYGIIIKYFPLSVDTYNAIDPKELALFDQLIYRFAKLQDSMGSRLFKQILEMLEEDISGLPFIDILYKLEKLNLISDAKEWIALRQTRNTVSHEYPFLQDIQVMELNTLPNDVLRLSDIWLKLKAYAEKLLNESIS
jgi:hypothetical protein